MLLVQGRTPMRGRGWCAFCGLPSTCEEYVPPRALFSGMWEGRSTAALRLIAVPSCHRCSDPRRSDAAYFRERIAPAGSTAVVRHTDVREETALLIRRACACSVAADRKSAGRHSALELSRPPTQRSASAKSVRWNRLKRTVERTLRGLYWHHRGTRVPSTFDVTVIGEQELESYGRVQMALFREIALASVGGFCAAVHPAMFTYSVAFATDGAPASAWVLCFYGKALFLGLVAPSDERGRALFAPLVRP